MQLISSPGRPAASRISLYRTLGWVKATPTMSPTMKAIKIKIKILSYVSAIMAISFRTHNPALKSPMISRRSIPNSMPRKKLRRSSLIEDASSKRTSVARRKIVHKSLLLNERPSLRLILPLWMKR